MPATGSTVEIPLVRALEIPAPPQTVPSPQPGLLDRVRRALEIGAPDPSAASPAPEAPVVPEPTLSPRDAAALQSRVRRLNERGGPFVGVRLSIYVARMSG